MDNERMSLEKAKKALSADCLFSVDGADGFFCVSHDNSAIEVEDIASAPLCYTNSFKSVDDMLENMEVGQLRERKGRVVVENGRRLADCCSRITVKRM